MTTERKANGHFAAGNRIWETRSSHGRKRIFATPEELWDAAVRYFVWVEQNPLIEHKPFNSQGEIIMAQVPKMRAMTLKGLCLFLDIDRTTFDQYEANADFTHIISKIRAVVFTQKFEGAAADQLNSSIISRELGLAEKSETKNEHTVNSSEELRGALQRIISLRKGAESPQDSPGESKPATGA